MLSKDPSGRHGILVKCHPWSQVSAFLEMADVAFLPLNLPLKLIRSVSAWSWTSRRLARCSRSVPRRRSSCSRCSAWRCGAWTSTGTTRSSPSSCSSRSRPRWCSSRSETWPRYGRWATNHILSR
jgi:hypothetical protein